MIELIDDSLYDKVWDDFEEKFRFKPSVSRFPGILEPMPSRTHQIKDYTDRGIDDSYSVFRSSFEHICSPDEALYFLDWQHQCYTFRSTDDTKSSAVTFYPDGDYAIILNDSMTEGIFGHPWEETLCFFGKRCLDYYGKHPLLVMGKLIRENI